MNLTTRCKWLNLISAAAVSAVLTLGALPAYAQEDEGPRKPPPTRSSEVLSERVYRQVAEIQELMNPEDPNQQPQMEEAKEMLDELNERYDSLNDFEKSTILNFYTNYYFSVDNMQQAIATFEKMLTIESLREEMRLRALMALGQLYMGEEEYRTSIDYLQQWRDLSVEENANVFLMLVNSHYYLEEFETAIPFLLQHMEMVRASGDTVDRNIYNLLFTMYVELENFNDAREVAREMVVLFDQPADWRNLAAVHGMLDQEQQRVGTLDLTYVKDYMDAEAQYMNLAQSLAGSDAPYQGARILQDGMEKGIVEETQQNLERLTQMYLMSNEYEMALEPARKAAEMDETGDAYDYLGFIYVMLRDYENAAEATKMAIQRGNLENPEDTQLTLARALVELKDFEGAAQAAREAERLGNDNAGQYLTYIEAQRSRHETLEARKADAIEFYRS